MRERKREKEREIHKMKKVNISFQEKEQVIRKLEKLIKR